MNKENNNLFKKNEKERIKKLILISKEEFDALDKANLIDYSKGNKNFVITSKAKKSKRKRYHVATTPKIKAFLGVKE